MQENTPREGEHISQHPDYKVTVDGDVVHRQTLEKATQTGGSTVKADEGGDLYT